MTIRYENHQGQAFILLGDGLTFIDPNDLHTWGWSYSLSNRISGMGGDASNFARYPRTFDLELRMRGMNRAEFVEQANRLHDITEADMVAGEPGRLYVDDQYLVCYLAVSGDKPQHIKTGNFLTRDVTVLAVEPYWCTPITVTLNPPEEEEDMPGWVKIGERSATILQNYQWNFDTDAAVSSDKRKVVIYEIPDGVTKLTINGYNFSDKYAAYGFYDSDPTQSGAVELSRYSGTGNTETGMLEVNVPNGAVYVVVNLANSLTRGIYVPSNYGKKFDLRYGYRYGTGLSGNTLNNTHYAPAPMIITFFGPATAPTITIDGVVYGADVILTATDRLVIDQLKHQVYIESDTGVKTSAFNNRIKTSDVFAPIQTGAHTVVYSGDFSAAVTMIYQRSELRWTA